MSGLEGSLVPNQYYGPFRPRAKPSRKYQSTLDIEAHLEYVHQLTIDAINTRDFDPKSEAWQHYANKIKTEIEVPPLRMPQASRKCTFAEHLEKHKRYLSQFPDINIECIRLVRISLA